MRWYLLFCLYLLNSIQNSVADEVILIKPERKLFADSDPVKILNFHNFYDQILFQPYSQIVLFYDRHGEQSQIYANVYKNLARSLLPGSRALQFDAIDCSDGRNAEVCFLSKVKEYPSARFYPQFIGKKDDLGEYIEMPFNKNDVINLLKEFRKFPVNIFPIDNIKSVGGIESEYENIICIFEDNSSLLGPQIILDLYENSFVLERRGYTNSTLAIELGIRNFPTTVGFSKKSNFSVPNILTFENSNVKEVEQAIREYIYDDRNNKPVSYTDLEMAIRRSLEVEATKSFLVKDATNALHRYLQTLIDLFPAKGNLRPFLIDLRRALSIKPEWDNKEVYDIIKGLEAKHYPVFLAPVPAKYQTCSDNGYPCALWLLFHTLLGQAQYALPRINYGPIVLRVMYGYVEFFQEDRIRADHFVNATKFYNMTDVQDNTEARLWLWWVHNQIRKLENDTSMTNDPNVIFPTFKECPMCRHKELYTKVTPKIEPVNPCRICNPHQDAGDHISWIISEVDDFLDKRFGYGRIAPSKFGK